MQYAAAALACLLSLGTLISCAVVRRGPVGAAAPEVCFAAPVPADAPLAASAMVDGEGPFAAGMLGKSTTLGGELFDTGAIDLFYVSVYDGFRVRRNRLYVADRVYRAPSPAWCEVDARISKVDERHQDHNEIDVAAFRPLDMAPVTRALDGSAAWVAANRAGIDVNRLKLAHDFAKGSDPTVAALDFNRTPYEPLRTVVGIDPRRGVAEFLCGRYVLREVKHHHAYYALVSVVYDLRAGRMLRVIVDPGGYREE